MKSGGTGQVAEGGRDDMTGAGEVAGEDGGRMAKMLRGIVAMASVSLPQKEGDVG